MSGECRGRKDSHQATSKIRSGSDSLGVPASLSLLKCPRMGKNAISESRKVADPRALSLGPNATVSRARPSPPDQHQRRAGGPRSVLPAQPQPGPWADSITSTRPPDLPARTAAALACCSRPPLPSRLPAAPSPSRHSKTPPCFLPAGSRRQRSCALARRGGFGRRKEGPPRQGRRGRARAPPCAWRCTAGAGAIRWPSEGFSGPSLKPEPNLGQVLPRLRVFKQEWEASAPRNLNI